MRDVGNENWHSGKKNDFLKQGFRSSSFLDFNEFFQRSDYSQRCSIGWRGKSQRSFVYHIRSMALKTCYYIHHRVPEAKL